MNWKEIKNQINKELKKANLLKEAPNPACPNPISCQNAPYMVQAPATHPTHPCECVRASSLQRKKPNDKNRNKNIREATLTADNTKFNIRTGVNKNPTKVGIKIQLEPITGYLEPNLKDTLEVAIQEKLNTALADYDIQVKIQMYPEITS